MVAGNFEINVNSMGKTSLLNYLGHSDRSRTMNLTLTAPLQAELAAFIESAQNQKAARAWLENPDIKVYVRKSQRLIEGKMVTALDISNATVPEDRRGQGVFTRFLNMAHDINPWDATYVENAQEDRFANYFWRRDWELYNDFSRSFYKKKNQGRLHDAWARQTEQLRAIN